MTIGMITKINQATLDYLAHPCGLPRQGGRLKLFVRVCDYPAVAIPDIDPDWELPASRHSKTIKYRGTQTPLSVFQTLQNRRIWQGFSA